MTAAHPNAFPRSATVQGNGAFTRIMNYRVREARGPLVGHAAPNGQAQWRIGISIGRRVGNAVTRNKIKRRLRESFRLSRSDWPGGFDLILIVRPHEPLNRVEYTRLLDQISPRLAAKWDKTGIGADRPVRQGQTEL
jgi:ribonuclease P protein component